VFAEKRISNSLQLAIGGFDSSSALVAFVSNWVKTAKLFLLLQSRSTIGVNYPGALCSMAALQRAFRNRHRQLMAGSRRSIELQMPTLRGLRVASMYFQNACSSVLGDRAPSTEAEND
jgi:hypothetical protein